MGRFVNGHLGLLCVNFRLCDLLVVAVRCLLYEI